MKVCTVSGCEKKMKSRGLCPMHLYRWQKTGDTGPAAPFITPKNLHKTCTIEGCDKPHYAHGYCDMHNDRVRKTGDPGPPGPVVNRKPQSGCDRLGCDAPHYAKGLCKIHYATEKARDRKARKRRLHVEPVSLTRLAQRDNFICGICGSDVDMSLKHPHPQSPTVDHVIPLIKQGEHSYANTQLAHLRCNLSERHDGPTKRAIA